MIKGLVFDMDGVIIDSEPIHIDLTVQVMRDIGKEPLPSEIYEFIGVINEEMWPILIARHDIKESPEELMERQMTYVKKRFFEDKLEPIDGIPQLMQAAKKQGMKIALATSSPRYFAEHILKNVGVEAYFDALVTADEISTGKPNPEIYAKAALALGLEPGECVAVEDACKGIQAAKGAGMKCIGFKNPNSGEQDTTQADFVVSSIRDITLENLDKL